MLVDIKPTSETPQGTEGEGTPPPVSPLPTPPPAAPEVEQTPLPESESPSASEEDDEEDEDLYDFVEDGKYLGKYRTQEEQLKAHRELQRHASRLEQENATLRSGAPPPPDSPEPAAAPPPLSAPADASRAAAPAPAPPEPPEPVTIEDPVYGTLAVTEQGYLDEFGLPVMTQDMWDEWRRSADPTDAEYAETRIQWTERYNARRRQAEIARIRQEQQLGVYRQQRAQEEEVARQNTAKRVGFLGQQQSADLAQRIDASAREILAGMPEEQALRPGMYEQAHMIATAYHMPDIEAALQALAQRFQGPPQQQPQQQTPPKGAPAPSPSGRVIGVVPTTERSGYAPATAQPEPTRARRYSAEERKVAESFGETPEQYYAEDEG